MEKEQQRTAKGQMIALMQGGHSQAGKPRRWQEFRSVGQQPTASCKKFVSKAKWAGKIADMDTPPKCSRPCCIG